ncbi:adenylate/guanylate cyclase domain-containing protein [Agromyces sp. M3QZ16-3]|uniref:adenylate/guanylate cyclase domain-containing protein n=1 Tax=Agromyces sp. M3QZ16-3 TaxID=3447585 RepID=UPI003F6902F3
MDGPVVRYTRDELAERSGVGLESIEQLLRFGVLAPAADGTFDRSDVQRVRLLEACDRAGLDAETIGAAVAAGRLPLSFMDAPQYRSWAELGTETYGRLADRLGIPFEVIRETSAALVNRRLEPDDIAREDDESIYRLIGMVAALTDLDAMIRIGRVYVDGLRRVTEAENELFQTYIIGGLMRSGLDFGEALVQAANLGSELTPLMEQMVLTLYRRQQERGWTAGIVEGIERAIEASGAPVGPAHPPAFVFIDLAGYTGITAAEGDATGARLARELSTMVERVVADHAGTPVKWLGDGIMVHFPHAGRAVRATLEMVEAAPTIGLPAHAGIAAGPVVMQDGDYFGRAVNLASRISGAATAGQTLVTGAVVQLNDDPGLAFRSIGPVELKGLAEPVEVFEAAASD